MQMSNANKTRDSVTSKWTAYQVSVIGTIWTGQLGAIAITVPGHAVADARFAHEMLLTEAIRWCAKAKLGDFESVDAWHITEHSFAETLIERDENKVRRITIQDATTLQSFTEQQSYDFYDMTRDWPK